MNKEQVKAEYKLWKEQNTRDMKRDKYMRMLINIFPYVMISIMIIGVIISFKNH